MVLGDGEDDGLAGAHVLAGRQLPVVLPGEPVELLHHQAVGVFVGPLALELGRVVVSRHSTSAPSARMHGDASGEPVGNEIILAEGLLDRVGEIRLLVSALVELEGVALDVSRGSGREADVERVEVGERRLPGAVDRAVALVGDHDIEITAGKFRIRPIMVCSSPDCDLLLLRTMPGLSQ